MAINWEKAAQITGRSGSTAGGINWEQAAKITGQKWNAGTSVNNVVRHGFTDETPQHGFSAVDALTAPKEEKKGWLQRLRETDSGTTEKPQMSAKPTFLELMGSQPINPEQIYGPNGDVSYILKSGGLGVVGAGADLAKAGAAAAAEEINRDHSAGAMVSRALGLEKSARDAANAANLAQNLKEAWENRGERGAGETAKDILFSVYDAATKRLKNQVGDSAVGMGAATLAALGTNAISRRTGKDEETVKKETSDRLYSLTDRYDEAVAQHQREGEGRDAATQTIANVVGQVGRMVPSFALSAVTGSPDAGLLSMAGGAGGAAAKEAYQNGASAEQAATIGLEKGLIEYGTEKMFSGFELMGDGIVSTMAKTGLGRAAAKSTFAAGLKDVLGKFASSTVGRLLLQGGELLGENVEEAVSDWLNSNLDSVVYGNGEGSTLKESFGGQMPWTPQGLVTILTSLIMSGSNVLARGNVTSDTVSEVVDTALDAEEQIQQTTPEETKDVTERDLTPEAAPVEATPAETAEPPVETAETPATEPGRTAPTQARFTEQALEGTPLEGRTTHEVHSDAQVSAEADARMQDRAGETSRLFGDEHQTWGDTDTEVAKRLISEAITKAKETGDWNEVARLRRVYDAEGTRAGQEMRQRRTFKNTPDDIISAAADTLYGKTTTGLDTSRKMTDAEKAEVMKNVEQFANDAANIPEGDTTAVIEQIKKLNKARRTTGVFRTNTSRTVSNMLKKVSQMEGGDAFLRNLLSAQIQGYANDYKAPSKVNQAKTFRVMNLLSKLSTVARNLVSNTVFDPVETLSNNISIPLDALLSKITGTRSVAFDRSWASKAKRQGSTEGFIKSYLQVAMDAEFDGETGKYEDAGARVFKMGGGAGLIERMLSQWQMYENVLLKSTDEFAKGGARAEAQRGADLLVERGLASQEGLADTASNIAKERTLQEESKLSSHMKKLRDAANTFAIRDAQGGSLGAGDVLLPFAQVPANVGLMNIRMNPFAGGAISVKNLVQTLKAAKNGTLTAEQQRQAVMSVGRTLTGTSLALIGAVLSAKGIIKVAGSDDKDKAAIEKAERQNGMQINLSAAERVLNGGSGEWQDGDTLMSIGFLEQIAGPLMLGNVLYDAYNEDESLGIGDVGKASLSSIAESMMELPAISQISGIVQDFQYSQADTTGGKLAEAAMGFAGNTAAGFLVPNAVRGIAQGMDNTVRNTYSSGTTLGNAWDYIRAGVPGLREQLPSTLDSWGQERHYTDSDVLNALNANILPGQITQYNTNDVNQELARLYEAGFDKVYPDRPANKATVNDEQLGAEALRQWNIDRGTTAYDLFEDMLGSNSYQAMRDEQKNDAITKLYEYAKAVANGKAGSNKEAQSWIANAYHSDNPADYIAAYSLYKTVGAEAYDALVNSGVNNSAALGVVGAVYRNTGGEKPTQEELYNTILQWNLDNASAEMVWNAFLSACNWKKTWEQVNK